MLVHEAALTCGEPADPGCVAVARDDLLESAEFIRGLRLHPDPELQRIGMELIVDAVIATDAVMLSQIDATNLNVASLEEGMIDLAEDFRDFEIAVDGRLDAAEGAISHLETSVNTLNETVVDLDNRVSQLEMGQAVIVDFMYGQMPPDAKVRYLASGAMDDRLLCPEADTDCDREELKESLIARFQAEADFQEAVQDVASVTGALNDISTIAGNLGIELPKEVNQAIGVANIAVLALSASTPLGAMAALSGLAGVFGGGTEDAQARQHAELMNYLDRRFDAIDARLLVICENQVKLMRGLCQRKPV